MVLFKCNVRGNMNVSFNYNKNCRCVYRCINLVRMIKLGTLDPWQFIR